MTKQWPFYHDGYYAGKLSYRNRSDFLKPWKHYNWSEITRMSQPWLARQGYRFIVHISYSGLLRRTYNRKKK